MSIQFTTPPGRIVMGSLYDFTTSEKKGVTNKEYWFCLAVPKTAGQAHWNQTPWGAQIWQLVHQEFANQVSPNFAWKITDGDSTVPNGTGKLPCDNEGYPGHWVIRFKSTFAAQIFNREGQLWLEKDMINCGDWVQVRVNASVNRGGKTETGTILSPSVYLNPTMVAFNSYGPRIVFFAREDVKDVGFGAAPMGSMSPVAAETFNNTAPATQTTYQQPVNNPPAPVVHTTPHTGILKAPPPKRQMTPKAGAFTYEDYVASGWTDAALVADELMVG